MVWLNWNKIALSLLALGVVSAYALGSTDGYSHIPGPQVLPHTAYQIYGQLGWHRIPGSDGGTQMEFPWTSGFRVGLFDRAEFGVEYGDRISLSGKMQFMQEEDWLPAWSFGARQVFSSQEAHLHSVADSLRDDYQGELFFSLGKTPFKKTQLNLGVAVIPGLNSGRATVFWGMTQGLWGGVSVLYDGYQRHDDPHHNFGLQWIYKEVFRFSVGATEVDRYFYQDGGFGFFVKDREGRSPDGYSAPGVWAMISLTGFMGQAMSATTKSRLDEHQKKLKVYSDRLEGLEERMDRSELQIQAMMGETPDSVSITEMSAEQILTEIVRGFQTETWDARRSRRLQDSLVSMGEPAWRMLIRTTLRESSSPIYRSTAIRIMGNSRQVRFVDALNQVLGKDSLTDQREAVMALAKIASPEAYGVLIAWQSQAPEELKPLLREVLKSVGYGTSTPQAIAPLPTKPEVVDSVVLPSSPADTTPEPVESSPPPNAAQESQAPIQEKMITPPAESSSLRPPQSSDAPPPAPPQIPELDSAL